MAILKYIIDWLTTPPIGGNADNQQMGPYQFIPAHLAQPPAISILVYNFDGPAVRDIGQRLQKDMAYRSKYGYSVMGGSLAR